jgi:hypothetical protein
MVTCGKRHVPAATVKELLEAVFSMGPCRGYIWRIRTKASQSPNVEVGLNTSILALQVIGGDEKGTQCLEV